MSGDDIRRELERGNFSREVLTAALAITNENEFMPIFELSESICEAYYGKSVFIRGIIEFTNRCRKNCRYCGIRRENGTVERYRLTEDEVLSAVDRLVREDIHTVVLQGGEDPASDDHLIDLIRSIRERYDMAVTLSVGERPFDVYERMRHAGADRFLLRIETTDPVLFSELHPDDDLAYRKHCLTSLKELWYEVGSGIMVGLPGQTIESIVNDLFYFMDLRPDMIGIGPFLPHKDTPLGDEKPRELFLTLKVMALIRITLRDVNIPATTAMGTLSSDGRIKAMRYGANVFMPNYTPSTYRGKYLLYDNKICVNEDCTNACAVAAIHAAGKVFAPGKGGRHRTPELNPALE